MTIAKAIFFKRGAVVGKDIFGQNIRVDGIFLNWFGRHAVAVVCLIACLIGVATRFV
jgi:hypothetical protein